MFRLFLAALVAVVSCGQLASAQAIDMRERVSTLKRLPLMEVNLAPTAYTSFIETSQQEGILSRVYAGPRQDARELGVLVGRRGQREDGVPVVDVSCRLHGERERPGWLSLSGNEVEGGAMVLAMEFRGNTLRASDEARWALLPPTACGLPVWWLMRTTDLVGQSDLVGEHESLVPFGLYTVPAVRGQIASTGRPAVLDPEQAYRILRIHDGVVELRQEWVLDTDQGGSDADDAEWLAWARRSRFRPPSASGLPIWSMPTAACT